MVTPNPADDGKEDGAFIEMKRENQVLCAQIKDLRITILEGRVRQSPEGITRKGRR